MSAFTCVNCICASNLWILSTAWKILNAKIPYMKSGSFRTHSTWHNTKLLGKVASYGIKGNEHQCIQCKILHRHSLTKTIDHYGGRGRNWILTK